MDILDKAKQSLKQITPTPKKIVVGVSGGADSVALTLILKKLDYELILAHLNHNARAQESDADEAFVAKLGQKLDCSFESQTVEIPKKGNWEENARKARYRFLEEIKKKHKADLIAVAHHQDDQVETILMHVHRGAGLRGISGMQFQKGHLIRPLLEVSKKELLAFLREENQNYREDQSNQDERFLRNKIRHSIIPKLKEENPFFMSQLLGTSKRARQELELHQKLAKGWVKEQIKNKRFLRQNFRALPIELKSEVLIQMVGQRGFYKKNIHELITFIESGKSGKKKSVKEKHFTIEYNHIRMSETAKEPKNEIQKPQKLGKKSMTWGQWKIKNKSDQSLTVRTWKKGDRFHPSGMSGSKKVQDFFVDQKIPRIQRTSIPIITNDKDEILSIGNLRLSQKGAKLKSEIEIEKLEV